MNSLLTSPHLIDLVPGFVVTTDLAGNYTYVNQWFLDYFGFEKDDVLNQSYLKTVHPDDIQAVMEVAFKCLAEPGTEYGIAMKKPNKKGEYSWSKWTFRALVNKQGEVDSMIAIGQNIHQEILQTEKLRKEKDLSLDQSRLFESILGTIQDGVVVCSMAGEFWVFNPAAKRYLGVGDIATSPDRWQEDYGIFHLDKQTPFAQEDLPMSRGLAGEKVRDLILFIRNQFYPEGRYLNSQASPLFDELGVQIGAVGILHDIDRMYRLQENLELEVSRRSQELVDSEARYRMLAEKSQDMICLHEPDGTYIFLSSSVEVVLGYPAASLLGRNPYEFIHPQDLERVQVQSHDRVLEGQTVQDGIELRFKHLKGHYVWLEVLSTPILDHQGNVVQIQSTSRDVTQRKYVEATLRSALNKEQELGELKSQLVSMASHQLRNPITALTTTLELTKIKTEKLGFATHLSSSFERMERQIGRMSNLVEEVLTLRRIESQSMKINFDSCSLTELLKEVVQNFSHSSNITFEDGPELTPMILRGDYPMLVQAFSNVISNAIKYSESDAPGPFILVSLEGNQVEVRIQDHGMGIDLADQRQLFQPFFRAKNALDTPGTGLGLSITKAIIEQHHGTISVSSQLGEGTTFKVYLPLAEHGVHDLNHPH